MYSWAVYQGFINIKSLSQCQCGSIFKSETLKWSLPVWTSTECPSESTKGDPGRTSQLRKETRAWIFNWLFCCFQELLRSRVSVWHWNAATRERSSAADRINELRQKVTGRASGLAAAADWCGAWAEMVGDCWLVVSVPGNYKLQSPRPLLLVLLLLTQAIG